MFAAAGASALLLAGILVIIRDKDGKKIGEAFFPDGHSADVSHTDSATPTPKVTPMLRGGGSAIEGDRPAPQSRSAGATLPEPPPLDDWLKGRKILTVSQDGKSLFNTIQAALDALRPGQVVEVLDRGPYRETLHLSHPRDAGLVSRVGTVVEFTAKREPASDNDAANDHAFSDLSNFRLSGFSFTADELTDRPSNLSWIVFAVNGDLVIENCRFADRRPNDGGLLIYWYATAKPGAVCLVRHSLFDTSATINVTGDGPQPTAIVEGNWIRKRSLMIHGSGKHVIVRKNVFDGEQLYGLSLLQTERIGRLEIYNNTFLSRIFAHDKLPASGVALRNNLLLFEGMAVGPDGLASLAAAAKGWEVGITNTPKRPSWRINFPRRRTIM